jgi:hypothetical protein
MHIDNSNSIDFAGDEDLRKCRERLANPGSLPLDGEGER